MIHVSEAALRCRGAIDCVAFDMDGVLIDITDSIRAATRLAPAVYLRERLGWHAPDALVSSADVELYKHAGGFNDDWELIQAVVALYRAKGRSAGSTDAARLSAAEPSHAQLAAEIAARGGGLAAARAALAARFGADDPAQRRRDFEGALRTFQALFAGETCPELYGFTAAPGEYPGRGLIFEDRCLLDPALLTLAPPGMVLGLLTGRSTAEMRAGRALCGLDAALPDAACVTSDDGVRKPDPAALALLARRLTLPPEAVGVFIGDTLDDFRTARGYNALAEAATGQPPFLSALVLTGPAGAANAALFRESGADIVAGDVNEVLRWILDP